MGVVRCVCKNRGFFDSTEIGEDRVGSISILGRACGNLGTSGEDEMWGVRYDLSSRFCCCW